MLDLLRAGCSVADLREMSVSEARILLEAYDARRAERMKAAKRAAKKGGVTAVFDVGRGIE